MNLGKFLKLLPGLVMSSVLIVFLFIPVLEVPPWLNKLVLALFIPIPLLINFISVNIRRALARGVADLDYVFLITHMNAIATGRPPRHKFFELYSVTGQAYGTYSRVLMEISALAKRWGYGYVEAIRHYLRKVRDSVFRDFLARFSEALSVGEDEVIVLEAERNTAMMNFEARYHRSLEILKILLGIYVATISSIIFININMILIAIFLWGSLYIALLSLAASVVALVFLVYAIRKLTPRDRLLHNMSIQPMERKVVAYTALASVLIGAILWSMVGAYTRDINFAFIALSLAFIPPGILAYRYENSVKRIEMFFQAFIRSYGLTYSVVRNHVIALRSILRVDLGPLAKPIRKLYVRLSNGIDKKVAWRYFAGEVGSENIRRCVDIVYDTIDSGGDIVKTSIILNEILLKIFNLRELRRQTVRAFQGVVYVLHVVMIVLLEFIVALISIMYTAFQAVAGAGVLPIPVEVIDIGILWYFRIILILSMSLINAIAIKTAEGGYIQTFWLHVSAFLVLGVLVSMISSSFVSIMLEALELSGILGYTP